MEALLLHINVIMKEKVNLTRLILGHILIFLKSKYNPKSQIYHLILNTETTELSVVIKTALSHQTQMLNVVIKFDNRY